MELELTIHGNQIDVQELSTQRAPGGLGSGTHTMTGNAKSGTLDAAQTTGPQAGRTDMGVYEVTGDTLKWCVTGRNRTRPHHDGHRQGKLFADPEAAAVKGQGKNRDV